MRRGGWLSGALVAAALVALPDCKRDPERATRAASGVAGVALARVPGDGEHGRALVAQLECNRCHDGTGYEAAPLPKHCVHCHQQILAGTYDAPKDALAKWQSVIVDLRDVPSLAAVGARFRRGWIAGFLLEPHDLRPRLSATMPRLAFTAEQARDVAAYLAPEDEAPSALDALDLERGRLLFAMRGCATCHAYTGAPAAESAAPLAVPMDGPALARAMTLAPDLRFTRDRFRRDALVRWIRDPARVKPDTPMPAIPMSDDDARLLAAYIVSAPLAPAPQVPLPARLPVLARKVGWDEVSAKVFRNTCWHCHGEPEYAVGDGGPGNTGGFGFRGRGLNVAEYEGIASGSLDDEGNRRSIFTPTDDGVPRLLRALFARQTEESGHLDAAMRGMPLGLPSLSPEDIQLVESWVAQGRPR